jgi:hypothetical protein
MPQQSALPQHALTVAALAENEANRTAANTTASAFSFIRISLKGKKLFETKARRTPAGLGNITSKRKGLNPKVVFEIKDGWTITEPWSQFTGYSSNRRIDSFPARRLDY